MNTMIKTVLAATLASGALAANAQERDAVTFATNWSAQAEHGGFYQALADGTYEQYGLDVTISPGGPRSSGQQLLVAGQVDFYMGGTSVLGALEQDAPVVTVAAIFQKDPQVLLAHPDAPYETLADLAGASKLIIGQVSFFSGYYPWMQANFEGFTDELFEPYTFNPAPFLADPLSVQQGLLTSEPFAIENETGWAPKVFLLADYGYEPYATTIDTRAEIIENDPDLVQRFVDASIIGWYTYLYGDNTAANDLIKLDNPEMTDEQIAYSIEKMLEHGIVVSGDAIEGGIGCMTSERWQRFYDEMSAIGVYQAGLDLDRAINTQFVCNGVGTELAPQ